MLNPIIELLVNVFEAFVTMHFVLAFGHYKFRQRGNFVKFACVSLVDVVLVTLFNFLNLNLTATFVYFGYYFITAKILCRTETRQSLFGAALGVLAIEIPPIVTMAAFSATFKLPIEVLSSKNEVYHPLRYVILAVVQISQVFICDMILRATNKGKLRLSKHELTLVTSVFFISFTALALISITVYNKEFDVYSILLLFAEIFMIASGVVCFYMTLLLNRANKSSEEYKLLSQQNEFSRQYADNVKRQYDEIRVMRHDIRQNYAVLDGLLSENKVSSALEYIHKQNESLSKVTVVVDVGNDRINSLLSSKLSLAKSHGIEIICSSSGDLSGADDSDLCVLLGNILDNAIEGCQSCGLSNTYIEMKITGDDNKIRVCVTNSALPNALENINKSRTSKKDTDIHGFGIKSIRKLADKYNGSVSYEQGENSVMCHVILYK